MKTALPPEPRVTLASVRPIPVEWCVALISLAAIVPPGQALTNARQDRAVPAQADPASGPQNPADLPLRIDAVVTDPQGRPILNLRPSDFELLENGASRSLTTVELRTPARPNSAAATPVETEEDQERAARQPGTRVFAFVLDEFHVTPGANAERARSAVSRFIDEQLQPQDLALVMRPLDAVTGIRFTRDRTALHAAIAELSFRKGDLAPRSAFEEQYIGRAPAAVAAARAQIVTAALRELTLRLGDLQADRGVVVLVSEGFARETAAPRGTRLQDLQGVVRASSRFHLALYTFNPGEAVADRPADDARDAATLEWLAAQTGGRAVLPGQDLAAGFDRLSRDLAAYYAITYRPEKADGRFHPIELRARRPNVAVRARPGYWAPLGGEWRALLTAGSIAPMSRRALRRSTVIDTWIGLASDASGRARMVISWEPRAGTAGSPRIVAITARTTAGADLFTGRVAPVQAGSRTEADSARFDVPTGRVELDMSILDMQGKVLDTEVRDFDVPDLHSQKRGPMLLFPEVVRARTLKDFQTAVADPDAAPSSARVFARGDRLLIRVPAYDSSGTAVQVSARVLNELGQPMRDIDSTGGAGPNGVAQFALPLSWLGPGQYLIELAGVNVNGAVKERVSFRVRG
jgi:VWFA-related protein